MRSGNSPEEFEEIRRQPHHVEYRQSGGVLYYTRMPFQAAITLQPEEMHNSGQSKPEGFHSGLVLRFGRDSAIWGF